MKKDGYESVASEDASGSSGVARGTSRVALVVSVFSCVVSLAAIGFVVRSLPL